MKTSYTFLTILFALVLLSSSCITKKKLTYLQFSGNKGSYDVYYQDNMQSVTPSEYKLMPYDNLFIRIVTPDPQWSEIFNIQTGVTGLTQESAGLSGYPIDQDGNIDMPYIGKVNVGGKTISEVKSELDSVFKRYVTDAALTVRLVNNYISLIGSVNAPGRYPLTKDRLNVFEAISMAGDLTNFSNRQKVQLIRPSPYGPVVKEFSLLDRSILTSELYYLMPNDIIYVKPISASTFTHNTSIFTLFLSTISSALVIISYFRIL